MEVDRGLDNFQEDRSSLVMEEFVQVTPSHEQYEEDEFCCQLLNPTPPIPTGLSALNWSKMLISELASKLPKKRHSINSKLPRVLATYFAWMEDMVPKLKNMRERERHTHTQRSKTRCRI